MADNESKRLQLLGNFPAPSDEQIKKYVNDYMKENPVVKTVNGIIPDVKGNVAIPGGSGFNDNPLELINEITLDQETFLVEITKDSNGEPFELEDFHLQVDALTTVDGSASVNGHLTINNVFMQDVQSGWGKDLTNMNYTHTLHYFNAGQVVLTGKQDGASKWISGKTALAPINRPVTKVQINLSTTSQHYQVGASFKLYGRRVKK